MWDSLRLEKTILQGPFFAPATPTAEPMPPQPQQVGQDLLNQSQLTSLIKRIQQRFLTFGFKRNSSQRPLEPPYRAFFMVWFPMAKEANPFSTSFFHFNRASWTSVGTEALGFLPSRTWRGAERLPSHATARTRAKSLRYNPSRRRIFPTRLGGRQVSRKIFKFFSAVNRARFELRTTLNRLSKKVCQ